MEMQKDLPRWGVRTNAQLGGFVVRDVDKKDSFPYARPRRFHGNVRKIVNEILKPEGIKTERSSTITYIMIFHATKEIAERVGAVLVEAGIGFVQECPTVENNPDAFIMPQVDLKNNELTAET